MEFNRPPRIQKPLPSEEVKIIGPPNPPSKPQETSWLAIILPIGAIFASIFLMMLISGNTSSGISYLAFIPFMFASYLVNIIVSRRAAARYDQDLAAARKNYAGYLTSVESDLEKREQVQRQIRYEVNPSIQECLSWISVQDTRLGERRVNDQDFLQLRLGVGDLPTSLQLQGPEPATNAPEFEVEYKKSRALFDRYRSVQSVPVVARLAQTGSIGIAGPFIDVIEFANALGCHLLVHHWPSEVKIDAIGDESTFSNWAWIRETPHFWRAGKTLAPMESYDDFLSIIEAELSSREQLVQVNRQLNQSIGTADIPLPRVVILFYGVPEAYSHPGLDQLLTKGPTLGFHALFLEEGKDLIPGNCGAIIQLNDRSLLYQETGPEGYTVSCSPDRLERAAAIEAAFGMARIHWPETSGVSAPPAFVTLLDLFSSKSVYDAPMKTWWNAGGPNGYLVAPIGKSSAVADLLFDLNEHDGAHGPHGLIGGMTGSGKSEVLKTILLAFAMTHHPYDLNFALVDYKGGAAFKELENLPHTVGVVTDIETHATYAERVILALSGEIEHRKQVLDEARKRFKLARSHIDDYRKLPVKQPMPRLVIVFDEFAEFKQRNPEESKKLISIARQGRSLGVHLILATQNIQAAVDPEILQNSTFKMCLKVSEPQDSMQMIGIPDAVNLTRGRAYFHVNTPRLFQVAFSGGIYEDQGENPMRRIIIISSSGRRTQRQIPTVSGRQPSSGDQLPTEANAIAGQIIGIFKELGLQKPREVWPEPLRERIYLPELMNEISSGGWNGASWIPFKLIGAGDRRSGITPILGLYDDPARQRQPVYKLLPETGSNHLLIFGSTGSGKSSLLRTYVTSICLALPPSDAHFYILDYGAQTSLEPLEALPHVGSVVTRLETERTQRMIQFIHLQVESRNTKIKNHSSSVNNWLDYNKTVPAAKRLPALFFIIDGFRELRNTFQESAPETVRSISALLSGTHSLGLFVVIAANTQADLPMDIFANISTRVTFNQADQVEYFSIVGHPSDAKIRQDAVRAPPPGRGLLRGRPPLEFQAALPVLGDTDLQQAENLNSLATSMAKGTKKTTGLPKRIEILETWLTMPLTNPAETKDDFFTVLGSEYLQLSDVGLSLVNDGPGFLITSGSSQSGKTTLIQNWLLHLYKSRSSGGIKFALIDFHSRTMLPFRKLPPDYLFSYVSRQQDFTVVMDQLAEDIKVRVREMAQAFEDDPDGYDSAKLLRGYPRIVVVIDDYPKFAMKMVDNPQMASSDPNLNQLLSCLMEGEDYGINFIISGNSAELPMTYQDPFIARIRKYGSGVLLSGIAGLDDNFPQTRRPAGQPVTLSGLPPGRGYLISRGKAVLMQSGVFYENGQNPERAIANIIE